MKSTFPHLLLRQDTQFWIEGQSLDTEQSISGAETVIPTNRGSWRATCRFAFRGEAATLQYQAFIGQMKGRLGTTLVPVHSRFRLLDGRGYRLPFCDVSRLGDNQTFEHWGFAGTDINRAVLAENAALRATVIQVSYSDTTGLRPGHYFSIGDRLHKVLSHWGAGPTHNLFIDPPLRAAAAAGTRLEIEKPVCKMRLASETEGVFDQSLDVLPSVTLSFREAI